MQFIHELQARRSIAGRLTNDEFEHVVFVIGSGLTTPADGIPGAPSSGEMIQLLDEMVRTKWTKECDHDEFMAALDADATSNKYQAAFHYLNQKHVSVDRFVRKVLLRAYQGDVDEAVLRGERGNCRSVEDDTKHWTLRRGIEALGHIIASPTKRRRKKALTILTSNFDPMCEIAARKAEAEFVTTIAARDSSLGWVRTTLPNIVHFHGYWFGSGMLHSHIQLRPPTGRRLLNDSIKSTLQQADVIVVLGYGGWDDVLMSALSDLVDLDDGFSAHVYWCLQALETDSGGWKDGTEPPDEMCSLYGARVSPRLRPLCASERICLVPRVDVDEFLPALAAEIGTALGSTRVAARPATTYKPWEERIDAMVRDRLAEALRWARSAVMAREAAEQTAIDNGLNELSRIVVELEAALNESRSMWARGNAHEAVRAKALELRNKIADLRLIERNLPSLPAWATEESEPIPE